MSKKQIELPLNGPQLDAYDVITPGATVFLGWGRGVGKSWFRRQIWWLLVAQWENRWRTDALEPFRGVRITSMCPTLTQWKDINWAAIIEEVGPGGKWAWLGAKLDSQRGQIRFPGGSMVRPFPASEYNARTARGMRTDVLDADEFDDIDASVYDGVAVPWLSEPWSLGIELLSGTPTRGRHGLWFRTMQAGRLGQKLRDGADPRDVLTEEEIDRFASLTNDEGAGLDEVVDALKRIYAFHATYRDAPETVSRRAVARAMATTPSATFKREWEADPDAGEGLVYPFDEDFHVRSPPDNVVWSEILVGCDHGWEDPGVLLLIGVIGNGRDAVCWVLEEIYEQHRDREWWETRVGQWAFTYRNHRFYGDPSRPETIEGYAKAGARVADVDNSLEDGISEVANRLVIRQREKEDGTVERFARLYVSPRCRNTIREFGLYRRRKHADGTFDEKPEDKHNHAMDALRYPLFNRFGPARPSKRHQAPYDDRNG